MSSVLFKNRDFSPRIQPTQVVSVERYSWHMLGGPKTAYLSVEASGDEQDFVRLLRCPVEIYGGDGRLNWYGYVNKVVLPRGGIMVGVGLDEMYNYVIVDYSGGTTAAASNAMSIAEYGQKEYRLSDGQATLAQGNADRDLYLSNHRYAMSEVQFSGGRKDIVIECYGWYDTLEWKYYTNAGTASTSNTVQIAAMVTSAGQFIAGTLIDDSAGIDSLQTRDGKSSALSCVNRLLNAGTSNGRPLLAQVDRDRFLHVYERTVEPVLEVADYILLNDGNLETPFGAMVPPEHCICSAWVQLQDARFLTDSFAAIRPFFIESAEYDAKSNRTTYRPADSFEQTRLDRRIRNTVKHGGGSDSSYYGDAQGPWITPTTETTDAAGDYAYYNYYGLKWSGLSAPTDASGASGITISGTMDTSAADATVTFTPGTTGLFLVNVAFWFAEGFHYYSPFDLVLDITTATLEYCHMVGGGHIDTWSLGTEGLGWSGILSLSSGTALAFKMNISATGLTGGIGQASAQIAMYKIG